MAGEIKVGLLGGTFDPVHNGHLAIAAFVREKLSLERILFVPAGRPWQKNDRQIAPVMHRVEMLRLAIKGKPGFELSMVEMERQGLTYTVDTIAVLQRTMGKDALLYFILGQDNLSNLPLWKDPQRLVKMCRLVAIPRPGSTSPDLESLEIKIPGLKNSVIILEEPHIDIGSTDIRRRVAEGLAIKDLVPPSVEAYIKAHRLYLNRTDLTEVLK
jgi:nicotinate-nucleotide adenylyltransferase